MSTVLYPDFARRAFRREADAFRLPNAETRADKLRRAVLDECGRRNVPIDIAHYQAAMALQILARNPTREPSALASNAVQQAIRAAESRNTDPPKPAA